LLEHHVQFYNAYRDLSSAVFVPRQPEELRNEYSIFVGKPEGKRPLQRPTRRWGDDIIMDLREIGWDGVGLTHLDQDRDQWRLL
jgi:hypothetical protein